MNAVCRLKAVARDVISKKFVISFETDVLPNDIDMLSGCDLDVTARKHRKKRSLNANNYFHKLASLIAEKTNQSLTECKNQLIAEYGQIDTDIKTIILDDEIDWRKVESLHLRPSTATKVLDNGKLYRVYFVMRGSHTYNTLEMSRLIDATVAEAKELNIETMTPKEIERMMQAWENRGK